MNQMAMTNTASAPEKKKGLFSRAIGALNNKTARTLYRCVGLPLTAFLVSRGAMAAGEDLMSAGRDDAESTFGENSTMMFYIMLAEVILVFLTYLKTHNPATFLLIPVFFVVTTVVFAILSSRAGG